MWYRCLQTFGTRLIHCAAEDAQELFQFRCIIDLRSTDRRAFAMRGDRAGIDFFQRRIQEPDRILSIVRADAGEFVQDTSLFLFAGSSIAFADLGKVFLF